MSQPGNAYNILETLSARDPSHVTIAVGGAAIVLQMEGAGVTGLSTPDVDTLCPTSYFLDLSDRAAHMTDAAEFTVRWPTGVQRRMGALHPSINIKPDPEWAADQLPYSTSQVKGSRGLVQHSWEELLAQPGQLVTVEGVRCLNVGEIFRWKAILGRRKDLKAVAHLMPRALEAGLITGAQRDTIDRERQASWAERHKEQGRYYARVPREIQ
jgi:hypothetical protein